MVALQHRTGLVQWQFQGLAWLNLLFFLGMLLWIRPLVELRALGCGGYYLHNYFANPEAFCKVTAPGVRGGFSDICAP